MVLGYSDTDKAVRNHVDEEDKLTRQFGGSGQNRNMTVINESGLYSLVLSSKLPGAKKFKRWVASEVLPSIRKHGAYMTPGNLIFGVYGRVRRIVLNCGEIVKKTEQKNGKTSESKQNQRRIKKRPKKFLINFLQ